MFLRHPSMSDFIYMTRTTKKKMFMIRECELNTDLVTVIRGQPRKTSIVLYRIKRERYRHMANIENTFAGKEQSFTLFFLFLSRTDGISLFIRGKDEKFP